MSYLLGIDVGTTRTAAAIGRMGANPGEIEMVNLGDRASSVPSVLFLGVDGSVLVGEVAERRAVTDPDRVVREFKRRLGDPTPFVVGGRAWAPEELSARLVRWVVDRVAEREGGPAARVAVTHPASWGEHKKKLLAGALAGQGLSVTFLAEPQAAALHYAGAERVEPGSTIAVYDLGGGTFDAAVVRKADPGASGAAGFGLLGRPEGIERLGGVDFDEVVFEHVREGLPGAFEGLDDSDPAVLSAVLRVRRECTEAKEALSSDTDVSIPVLLPGSRGSVRLHRSEFEGLIRPQVEQTVAALRRAVSSAGLAPEDLSAVLLVGGSSRIPLVSQLVSEQLGRPVAVDADPKNAIAKGAALALVPRGVSGTGANAARVPSAPVPAGRKGPSPGRPPIGAAAGGAAGSLASTVGAGSDAAATIARTSGHPAVSRPAQPAPAPAGPPQRRDPVHQDPPVATPGNDSPEEFPSSSWNPAVLIGAGGLAAVAAVLTVVFLLSGGQDDAGAGAGQPRTVAPASSSPPAAPPPTEEQTVPAEPPPSRAAPRTTPPPVSTTPPPTTSPAPTTSTTSTTPPSTTTSTSESSESTPPPP